MVELNLINGVNNLTITDGSLLDQCPQANCVTFAGTFGNWTVVASTGITNNAPPFLDLSSSNFTVQSNPGALIVQTSANGYNPGATGFSFGAGGTLSLGTTYTFSAFLGNGNVLLDESNQLGSNLVFTGTAPGQSFGGNIAGSISPISNSPYSLTLRSVLTGVTGISNSQTSYNASLNMSTVPEPAVVTLLGGILLCTVGAIRRKARRT
jgi:hypothetical protein